MCVIISRVSCPRRFPAVVVPTVVATVAAAVVSIVAVVAAVAAVVAAVAVGVATIDTVVAAGVRLETPAVRLTETETA